VCSAIILSSVIELCIYLIDDSWLVDHFSTICCVCACFDGFHLHLKCTRHAGLLQGIAVMSFTIVSARLGMTQFCISVFCQCGV
jgi:hypothetical protein